MRDNGAAARGPAVEADHPVPSPDATDPWWLSARALVAGYRAGSLSPVEVTAAVLQRIEAVNPRINALFHVNAEGALSAAAAAEARWRQRAPIGPLDGVPVTLKDSIAARGMPIPHGTRAAWATAADEGDAPVTARLREAGAVLLGKTTMPDFGMIASGISSLHGVTRNPWDLSKNTGGSSSGAGAAVAAGFGPLAIGTDMGGSVRIPAAFCGAVGLKPSQGRVPLSDPWPALVAGPMARSAADAALLLGVISRPDPRDYSALPWDDRDYLDGIADGINGHRFGLLRDIGFGAAVEPEIEAALDRAARLIEGLGGRIEPMPPLLAEDAEHAFDRMIQAYAWPDFAALAEDQQARVLPVIAEWCRPGRHLTAGELTATLVAIGEIRRRVVAAFAGYDYVLAPTVAIAPFAAELAWPEGGSRHHPFCFPFNLSEQPALSVPCGLTAAGLPIGLQIIGRRFDDAGVLRIGHAYEQARGPLPSPPLR